MISMDKQYQTRDGREVRIYAVDGGGFYPIQGAVLIGGRWIMYSWSGLGYINRPIDPEANDLIEVPKIIKAWVNIYPFSDGYVYKTREEADKAADFNRIACVQIEFKEGEGLCDAT